MLSQQLAQVASLVMAQGKGTDAAVEQQVAGLVGIWGTCPLTPEVEQTHLFQGLTLCTDVPEATQKSQIQGPTYLHCLGSNVSSCL